MTVIAKAILMRTLKAMTLEQLWEQLGYYEAQAQACFGESHITYMSHCADIRNIIRAR